MNVINDNLLTPAQKTKVRKMRRAQDDAIQPIFWARNTREHEVRIEAWKALNCSERIAEMEAEYRPQIAELEEQRRALQDKINELSSKMADLRSDISVEPYQAVYADEQYKAMTAIIKKTKEVQKEQLEALLESFKK